MNVKDIAIVIQARLSSTRIPRKMIRPFAGTTLFDIALEKVCKSAVVPIKNVHVCVYEQELIDIAKKYPVSIIERSRQSSEEADDPKIIMEWYKKLPEFKYFVQVNACLPLLSISTIDDFILAFMKSGHRNMFSTVSKKNFIFMNGVMINHFRDFNPPCKIMNTSLVPEWKEAAHCLYAGPLDRIQDEDYMGTFTENDPVLFDIPEREFFDIDYPWEFSLYELIYKGLQTPPKITQDIETFKTFFKNKHYGEVAYFMCSGPSINHFEEQEPGKYIIVNRTGAAKPKLLEKASYVITEEYSPEYKQLPQDCFYMHRFYDDVNDHRNVIISSQRTGIESEIEYTSISKKLHGVSSMSYIALLYTCYLGFSKIYLVGADASTGNIYGDLDTHSSNRDYSAHKVGYPALFEQIKIKYPKTTIISMNPVGLKGIFHQDVFTNHFQTLNHS